MVFFVEKEMFKALFPQKLHCAEQTLEHIVANV